jgi:heavy metal sensor kinase
VSRLPIRLRLTLVFAVVMAVVFAAVGAILYVRLGDTLDERIADTLEARTSALASTFDVSSPAAAGEEGLAQVLEIDGSIVAGSTVAAERPLLSNDQLAQARTGSIVFDVELTSEAYRLRATPVDDRVVVVGEPLDDRDEALAGLLAQLSIVLPLALLVSSAIGYLVAGAALRPVEAMRRDAAEISADTPERRLPLPRAHDELYRLAETLNEMLERLDAGLERERRFVADASHELRTPLAALRTELELAARRPRTQAELEAALGSAGEEVDRLVRLAEDLLVLARAEDDGLVLDIGRHDVRAVLDAVAARNDARAVLERRTLAVSAPAGLVVVGDRRRLEQALEALVDNAFRHGTGTVRLEGSGADDEVVLEVADEGQGFPPEFLPHAFERFSRADEARSGGGAGLGLAIVQAIAVAHGGAAGAAMGAGGGTAVWISVPTRLNAPDAPLRDRERVG